MSKLTIYWNSVIATDDVNLRTLANIGSIDQSLISSQADIAEGCRGIYFRSVLTNELDFSAFLSSMKLEDVRKSRNEPDGSLLYKPKCKGEQSIGVLRIVRPKRFGKVSGISNSLSKQRVDTRAPRGQEFDVLLESTEFILEDAQEQMAERYQLQETFGDFNVFFFGKRAEIFSYSGSLLNAAGNLQWRNQFLYQYENYLRGSKCAELKARAYLLYDDIIREGFILSAAVQQSSSVDGVVKFNFTLLVTNKKILGEVPKTRSGVITLASDVSKVEGGVTDFKFIRTVEPNLPGVGDGTSKLFFKVIGQPGGDTIPADLAQLLRKQSLSAVNAVGGEVRYSQEDTVIEQDVLLNFIHMGELSSSAKSTARMISGDNKKDSGNSSGARIATQILEGTLPVEDLKLKEAIDAADSMVNNNSAEIGDAIEKLREASDFFSSQEHRVSSPPPKIDGATASNYQESQQYVLTSKDNDTNLVTLIDDTAAIAPFLASLSETTKTVISSASARLMSAISDVNVKGEAETVIGYIAAFCLLKSPTGSTMSSVAALPDISAPGPDFIEYVKKQRIGKLRDIMKPESLPKEVVEKTKQALDGIKGTSLVRAISGKTGIPIDGVELSDGVIQKCISVDFPAYPGDALSITAATFLTGILTYVTGILAEKASPPQACTGDFVATGPLLGGSDIFNQYFTQAYVDAHVTTSGSPFSDLEPTIYQARQRIVSGPGGKYLVIPLMSSIEPAKVTFEDNADGFLKSAGNPFAGVFGDTLVPFTADPQGVDAQLFHVGYMKLYQSIGGGFFDGMDIAVAYRGRVRKRSKGSVDAKKVFGSSRKGFFLLGKDDVRVSDYLVGGKREPSATVITDYPAKRAYLGTNEYPSAKFTLGSASKFVTEMTSIVSLLSDKVFAAMGSIVTQFIESGQAVLDPGLEADLSIARFIEGPDAIPAVTNASKSMIALGVTSTTYIDFTKMAKIEQTVVDNLKLLKDSLEKAVINAGTPEGRKAAEISKSDVSSRNVRCGEGSGVLVGPDPITPTTTA